MRLSLFRDIFCQPWMIEPQTASANREVLVGILTGLEFTQEEPVEAARITHKEHRGVPVGREIDVVDLAGTMFRDDAGCGLVGTRTLARQLLEADAKEGVIGHILRIDSGGGASNSVPDLADAIRACDKPVVALVDGYMCSAAMYAGSYCDYIFANRPDDRVGCIGTLVQIEDYPKQAKDDHGMVHLRVYADGAEEKNSEYEAALEGDFKLIKERILNPLNRQFKADVKVNRPNTREDQLTGRTYFARETVGSLIDAIGGLDQAVAKVIELSNIKIQNIDMEGYQNIQRLSTCSDLQMVDDTVTLNREQLDEVEEALASVAELDTVRTELADANAKIEEGKARETSLQGTVAERDNEIVQLKATIETLNQRPDPASNPMHNGNPVGEPADNANPEEYCRNLISELR